MRQREIKRRVEVISFYDHAGIAAHLEQQAAKGWLIEKANNFFWTYRKIQPKKLTFSITYFPMASEFDPVFSEEQQIFVDYCAQAGWHLAATSAQMQIFYSEDPAPTPIETDAVTQVENIHRAMKRNFLPAHFVLMGLAVFQLGMLLWRFFSDPVDMLLNQMNLLSGFPWLLVLILCLTEVLNYFRWRRQAVAAAQEEDRVPPTRSTKKFQMTALAVLGIYLVIWFISLGNGMNLALGLMGMLYMALLLVLVNLIKHALKKKGVSKNVNRAITFTACFVLSFALIFALAYAVISMDRSGWFEDPAAEMYEFRGNTFYKYYDDLPLSIEDLLGEENSDFYSYRSTEQSSIFLAEYTADQSPTLDHLAEPDLHYTIYEVKFPPLYGLCKEELLSQFDQWNHVSALMDHYMPVDPAPWQAEEVYQRYMGEEAQEEYIICWPRSIVEISFDWTPTAQQKATVAERLKP